MWVMWGLRGGCCLPRGVSLYIPVRLGTEAEVKVATSSGTTRGACQGIRHAPGRLGSFFKGGAGLGWDPGALCAAFESLQGLLPRQSSSTPEGR